MDLGPVDRITAGTIGEPGSRTFFLQARAAGEIVTVVVEKQQVQLLAASILELLADLELETGAGPGESELSLEEPIDPRWRAGKLSIGYDHDRALFVLEIEELTPGEEDEDAGLALGGDHDVVQLAASREQMFALSRHSATVVGQGRPACQFCGNPMDAEGHACPAMNGHSKKD
ncbi:MAG: DUF3090 domain-containing protein [Actinomycetota bacterium]